MAKILLVDDDLNTCQALHLLLDKDGHQVLETHSGKEALEKVRGEEVDLAVIDWKMPGMDGLEFFQTLKTIRPEVVGLMISAHATVDLAVSAIKGGVYDFITKPFRTGDIKKAIARALEAQALVVENRRLRQALKEKASFTSIIGKSPPFVRIMELVVKIAPTRSTVLLTGESGTGKEIIAEALHFASTREDQPLIKVNCGALSESLLESELFGHEKGAFTGAFQQRLGRFESADRGTIFLDEIGEMSPGMQVKLLRVLQDGVLERVGSSHSIRVDVRILAATNRNLEEEVEAGRFRQDLFYRLNVISIEIPPLRERLEDIPLLANFFINKYRELNNKKIQGFSPERHSDLDRLSLAGQCSGAGERHRTGGIALPDRDHRADRFALPNCLQPAGGRRAGDHPHWLFLGRSRTGSDRKDPGKNQGGQKAGGPNAGDQSVQSLYQDHAPWNGLSGSPIPGRRPSQ